MTNEEKLQILDRAEELAYTRLSKMTEDDMTGEEFAHLMQNLSAIYYARFPYVTEDYACSCGGTCSCHDDADTPTPKPELTPAPSERPGLPDTPAEETAEPTLTLVDVRVKLADLAGSAGVDLPALLAQFGAAKLSEVDPSKYEALLAAANKAAEGA